RRSPHADARCPKAMYPSTNPGSSCRICLTPASSSSPVLPSSRNRRNRSSDDCFASAACPEPLAAPRASPVAARSADSTKSVARSSLVSGRRHVCSLQSWYSTLKTTSWLPPGSVASACTETSNRTEPACHSVSIPNFGSKIRVGCGHGSRPSRRTLDAALIRVGNGPPRGCVTEYRWYPLAISTLMRAANHSPARTFGRSRVIDQTAGSTICASVECTQFSLNQYPHRLRDLSQTKDSFTSKAAGSLVVAGWSEPGVHC